MKIIGKTTDGFILEAGREEVECIAGVWNESAAKRRELIASGEIPVTDLYARAVALCDTHQTAVQAAKELSAAAATFISYFDDATTQEDQDKP